MKHVDGSYAIHEVYYSDDDKVTVWTEEPVNVIEDSLTELRETLDRMVKACNQDVLNYADGKPASPTFHFKFTRSASAIADEKLKGLRKIIMENNDG